jgi:hypothetical protein
MKNSINIRSLFNLRDHKFKLFILICLILLFSPATSQAQNLLSYPQKIVIDSEHERLLVSNYGNGALVEIDSEGNQEYFEENAGFIDGMDIVDNVVYGVGSQRRLIAYDLDTEEEIMEFSFPGNTSDYLSSVTSDSMGHLFISCPPLHTIYKFRISDQSYWIFAEANGLNRPNGIFLERENDRIVVIDDSPGQSIIHAISLSDSTVSDLLTTDLDRPDGIVRARTGEYYIGGYYLPGLYKVDADFSSAPELFFVGNNMVYPTYDTGDHSILITRYSNHDWERILLPGGTLLGTVSTTPYIDPEEIEIQVDNMVIIPDPAGVFTVRLPLGMYNVTAFLANYETITWNNAVILEDQMTSVFFMLSYLQAPEDLQYEMNENVLSLTWDHLPPEREFQNFLIYRNIDGSEFEYYASSIDPIFQEILEPGAEYGYFITALYEQENESEPSNIIYVNWNGTEAEDLIEQSKVSLFQNVPNPFNPFTIFSFQLSEEISQEQIVLEIFNAKGQRMRSYADFEDNCITKSKFSILWDGTDIKGDQVPSGIYLYRIRTDDKILGSRKCILLK